MNRNPQYNLRIPVDLKEVLTEKAVEDGRSLNSLIIKVLKEWVKEPSKQAA